MNAVDLTAFVRTCEKTIAQPNFVPAGDRDKWRVYALARLVNIVESGSDVELMLVVAPGLYESIRHVFHSLLCSRGLLWWQSHELAKDESWPRYMREAITDVARHLGVEPRALAKEMDRGNYPWMRALVIAQAERVAQ